MMSDGKTHRLRILGSHETLRKKCKRKNYSSDISFRDVYSIGRWFSSGVERQSKWIKDWKKLLPMLEPCRATLCFN